MHKIIHQVLITTNLKITHQAILTNKGKLAKKEKVVELRKLILKCWIMKLQLKNTSNIIMKCMMEQDPRRISNII